MSPTCSNSDLAGRNALLTADPTICSSSEPRHTPAAPHSLAGVYGMGQALPLAPC